MGKLRIGINGMGRIGRTLVREWFNRKGEFTNFEIVAVNNPGEAERYVHLLKYDSVHGPIRREVHFDDCTLTIDQHPIKFFSEREPENIPWSDQKVDIVIDSTGKFKDYDSLKKHLGSTVKKVILCAPGKNVDATIVMGVNDEIYSNKDHHIISNASCTTNCLAPLVKVIQDKWGIEAGQMVTVHSYTSDQSLLDKAHKDFRRARAAGMSMIPTTTGAAKSLGDVIPELKGKLDGHAIRVPTPNVSLIDITLQLNSPASIAEINEAVLTASEGKYKNIIGHSDEELVSIDFTGRRESSIFDASLTKVIGKTVKLVTWYDNEAGFSNRVLELTDLVGKNLNN